MGWQLARAKFNRAVQGAIKKMPGLQKEALSNRQYQTPAVGADVTSMLCNGEWVTVGIGVDALNGLVITIDELPGPATQQLKAWLAPILEAVDADVLITDDADAFKTISDETGRSHQICKSHVVRNTESLVAELAALVQAGADQSLQAIGVSPAQALLDLSALQEMIHTRLPEDQTRLEELDLRYANAPRPGKGKKHTLAYRLRNLFMDRWNLWPRLTFYRTWKDTEQNEVIDGTNNACERAIGWWIKERYRSMRGYKQVQSALGVSRLIALAGNNLAKGLRLADLVA